MTHEDDDRLRENMTFEEVIKQNRPLLVLVTGSRNWTDPLPIRRKLERLHPGSIIIHGFARGADRLAGEVAAALRLDVRPRPADWELHGRAAGIRRNEDMLKEHKPDLVLAFHPNLEEAKGTKHMVEIARKAQVLVIEVTGAE